MLSKIWQYTLRVIEKEHIKYRSENASVRARAYTHTRHIHTAWGIVRVPINFILTVYYPRTSTLHKKNRKEIECLRNFHVLLNLPYVDRLQQERRVAPECGRRRKWSAPVRSLERRQPWSRWTVLMFLRTSLLKRAMKTVQLEWDEWQQVENAVVCYCYCLMQRVADLWEHF